MFKFKPGRQGTGYDTMTLLFMKMPQWFQLLFSIKGVDGYIIRYNDGSCIPPHVDSVDEPGLEHHRLNIVLSKPKSGGEFICEGATRIWNRIFYFRPDIQRHEVTPCVGTRIVLSVGIVKMSTKMPLLSVDEALFGPDDMEKPTPDVDDLCLLYDGENYWVSRVTEVDTEKKVFAAIGAFGTTTRNVHFCRFRPYYPN